MEDKRHKSRVVNIWRDVIAIMVRKYVAQLSSVSATMCVVYCSRARYELRTHAGKVDTKMDMV